ncbi:MAG: Hsp33 family molecular chaperone HslO [Mariprofundales bacterium]|nr:Hsp33 family molecular chaperone HslO [Mariprofundales bacterium]
MIRFLLPQLRARGAFIHAENIVAEGTRIHGLTSSLATLFGQVLIGSMLLLSISKGGVRQVLQLDGTGGDGSGGRVQRLLAESRQGAVRGYLTMVDQPRIMTDTANPGLHHWMGNTIQLSTVRDLGFGTPYISATQHHGDFLSDHLLHYLHQSVQVQAEIIIHGNSGLLIEAMPGSNPEYWQQVLQASTALHDAIFTDGDSTQLAQQFQPLGYRIVGQDPYHYRCNCNTEQMVRALAAMAPLQLSELADESGQVTACCQYCGSSYSITPPPIFGSGTE